MALKMNWFQSGPRISSLVWPRVLKMFCCLAVVVGGYPPAKALNSVQGREYIDFVPIVVIPYPDNNSRPPSENSNGRLVIHTIKCESNRGITKDCVTTIQQTINDLQKQKRKHKLIVELYDKRQLSTQLKNLVVPAPLFVDAFYLRCISPSVFEKTKCRGGTPWSYDPFMHAAGKYVELGTRKSVEFSHINSPVSFISFRKNEWHLRDVTINYIDFKSPGDEKIFPSKDTVLSWKGNGLFLHGHSSEPAHRPNRGQVGNALQRHVTRTAQAIKMFATKQTPMEQAWLTVNGAPFEYTFSLFAKGVRGVLHSSKVLGLFSTEDIHAPATIYVFYLHEEAQITPIPLKHKRKGHKIVEVDCYEEKKKKISECIKELAFDKKKDKKDQIDIYVVSSHFLPMTMFTRLLDDKHGAYRDGKLWADYVFEEPRPRPVWLLNDIVKHFGAVGARVLPQPEPFSAQLQALHFSMQHFNLAALASYKAFAGGLVEYLGRLCFTFTVRYNYADWELFVDNKSMDRHFELDPSKESVSLEWSLEKITVRQASEHLLGKKLVATEFKEKCYAHPPLSREFRLRTRRKGTTEKATVVCNDKKKKKYGPSFNVPEISWKRLIVPIAIINNKVIFDFDPDYSRTWNQLESLK